MTLRYPRTTARLVGQISQQKMPLANYHGNILLTERLSMQMYTLVKVFDLAMAPSELQDTAELQVLKQTNADQDEPMLKVWVGPRTTTIEPPVEPYAALKVSVWEHYLHKWLSKAGAVAGDTVFLTWTARGHA